MGIKLFLLLMITASICAQSNELYSYRSFDDIDEYDTKLNDADCKMDGLSCIDSDTLIYCQKMGAGFKETAKKKCSEKDKTFCCMNNKCTSDGCPGSGSGGGDSKNKIQCQKPGRFPSPFNCSLYYICDKDLKATEGDCGCATFNATAGKCVNTPPTPPNMNAFTEDIVYDACTTPPKCNDVMLNCSDDSMVLDMMRFKDYPQYYAYCVSSNDEFVVDKCEDGYAFTDMTGTCDLACPSAGNFPYPSDCHKYYVCTAAGDPGQKTSCAAGTGFNPDTDGCEPEATVAACSGQGSSTTTAASSTSAGTGSHSDATTQQSGATTVTPSSTTVDNRFHCPSRGTFVDPGDCHSYYFCFQPGDNYRHISCSSGAYFNTQYGRCVFGSC